jgi:hypothetical protein
MSATSLPEQTAQIQIKPAKWHATGVVTDIAA